jgi:hypothetical protein
MKPNGALRIVLSAREIVHDHEPTDVLLSLVGTSTKELMEMFLNTWVEFKQGDRLVDFEYGERDQQSTLRMSAQLLVADIIFDAMEKRIEQGLSQKMDEADRRTAEKVMLSIWASLREHIFELLTELQVSDLQMAQLRFVRWIGDDFIVSIPRQRIAIPTQVEKTNERESTPAPQ